MIRVIDNPRPLSLWVQMRSCFTSASLGPPAHTQTQPFLQGPSSSTQKGFLRGDSRTRPPVFFLLGSLPLRRGSPSQPGGALFSHSSTHASTYLLGAQADSQFLQMAVSSFSHTNLVVPNPILPFYAKYFAKPLLLT